MLQVTAAIYDWWNFTIQLNSNHYSMFLWSHKPERNINKAENESTQKKYKSFSKTEKKKVLLSVCSNINFQVYDSTRNSWQGKWTWLGAKTKLGWEHSEARTEQWEVLSPIS